MADLTLHGVTKAFGSHVVLDRLSLQIRSGECFTIIGPSGCGKTVILRLIAGFETPDQGEVLIGNKKVAGPNFALPPEDRHIGVVFQDYAVWPHKTVFGNIAYPLELAGVAKSELNTRVHEAIALVNLKGLEQRFPYQLSGGQQQRVALARALVMKPEILLLDEPLTNLDANLREEMRFEIKEIQKATGATILYVTHDQEVAMAISDRLAVMDQNGRIHQIGSPEEVYTRPADDFVFKFLGISNMVPITSTEEKAVASGPGGMTEIPLQPPTSLREQGWLGFRPMDVQIAKQKTERTVAVHAVRVTLLGPIVDYLFDCKGLQIRAQMLTEDALAQDLIIEEGSNVFIAVDAPHWFNAQGEAVS